MLKRPRAQSPSPTRPDASSPPPFDNSAHVSFKRRRTAGPVLDSNERRGRTWNSDDGEDDYEDADSEEEAEAGGATHDKEYEHVNHVLHGLHAEQQHRSHALLTHPHSPVRSHSHAYRDQKDGQTGCSSPAPYRERGERQESEDGVDQDRFQDFRLEPERAPHKDASPPIPDDERLHVLHRYEDTNRLLGSLVLSRRRTLEPLLPGLE